MRWTKKARFAFLLLLGLWLSGCQASRPWNVLLITLDTTRADFLGCYGKDTALTPTFDRMATQGFLFEKAVASNPVTQPSHSTILTGTYPLVHGVRDNSLFHLPDESETLAEILAAHGYATGAAIGGFPLTEEFGTAQGFAFYDDNLRANRQDLLGRPAPPRHPSWYDERPAGNVNDAILPWLRQHLDDPFFVWLHYWDPHHPHIPPPPYNQLFAHSLYEGEIAYADQSLGTILRVLETAGVLDRTLVVITADHGEGFGEHGEETHAFLAYNTTLHVPLILRVPGQPGGRRISQQVGTVDIVPTALDLLEISPPVSVQGRSLVPLMFGEQAANSEPPAYYSESLSPRLTHGFGELRVLYQGPFKYIYGPRPELYNLVEDPAERRDLSDSQEQQRDQLKKNLQTFLDSHASPSSANATYEASAEARRRLAALGYLSTSGEAPGTVTETLRPDGLAPQDRVGDINLASRLRQALARGAFALAKQTARQLLLLVPDNGFYRAKLASAHLGLGQLAEAAQLVDDSETISAANTGDFFRVAWALFEGGEQERGRAMAQRLVEAEATAEGWFLLARMASELDDNAAFEKAIEQVLALEPEHALARLERATALVEQQAFDRAEEELQLLLKTHPIHAGAHLGYARLLRDSGRPAEALTRFARVLRLAPASCEAHIENLTLLLELDQQEQTPAALRSLRKECHDEAIRTQAAELMEAK